MTDMRKLIDLLESAGYKKGDKIGRWAFLYLEPRTPEDAKEFAQCSTCQLFMPGKKRCAIFGPDDVVKPLASCGLYLQGKPHDNQKIQNIITPEAAGYMEGAPRCENCSWYKEGTCGLFSDLDKNMSDTFELGSTVSPKGCCNAWS